MTDGRARVRLRRDLLAAGFTDDELRQRRRSGALRVLRPGAYLAGGGSELPPLDRHGLLVRAEVARLASDAVVSHVSAAVLHGLPVSRSTLGTVHVTRSRRNGGRRGSAVHVHTAPLDDRDVVALGGLAVTSVARTVIDLARSGSFEWAVVCADAALRSGDVGSGDLVERLRRCSRWPGASAARRVVAFADGASESVGESRSRVAIHDAGLPAPTLQWAVRRAGRLIGRCDFAWPEHNLVGEFDGRVKYGRLLRPGQDPGDAVFEEKLREDDLRAHGLSVVRWVWRHLDDFAPKADQIRAALAAR